MKQKLLKLEQAIIKLPQKIKELYHDTLNHIAEAKEKMKDIGQTNYNLGLFHINQGNLKDAKFRLFITIKMNKNVALCHYHLARCYIYESKIKEAIAELEKSVILEPNFVNARYRLNILNKAVKDLSIPIEVIKEDYNYKAKFYEEFMLQKLEYKAPEILVEEIVSYLENKNVLNQQFNCVEFGCGTGIAGAMLNIAVSLSSLVGVDLSKNMLSLALALEENNKKIYNEIIEADYHIVDLNKRIFDICLSCFSLDFSNNLDRFFDNLKNYVKKGTIFGIVGLKSETSEAEYNYEWDSISRPALKWEEVFDKNKWKVIKRKEIDLYEKGPGALLYVIVKS